MSHPFILDYQHAQDYSDLHSNPHDLHTALHIVATDTHHTQKELQDHTKDGRHSYTEDLLHIDSCRPTGPPVPPYSTDIVTPLDQQAWASALQNHPDQYFCRYICEGISRGFRIGSIISLAHANQPLPTWLQLNSTHNQFAKYLAEELEAKRIVGPLPPAMSSKIQVNRFGVIPKRIQPGKWRLITDLSHPEQRSVNDGINPDSFGVHYASVDDAVQKILSTGRGTRLAKIDVQHAFRNIPVHPQDRTLLGMEWDGHLYMDTTLPFGLRSAPKIFCSLADALEWVLLENGVTNSNNYLDDFLTMG